MERRQGADRRQMHMFVSQDRRSGPFDRRGAAGRQHERMQERQAIERIRAYKEKDRADRKTAPLLTRKQVVYLSLTLLIILVIVILAS